MDFLGIGLPELAVILVLALIVVGPKRLPEAAAQIARTIREVRRYSSSMTRELNAVVKDLEREYEEVKGEIVSADQGLRESAQSIRRELTGAAEDARRQITDSVAEAPARSPGIEDASRPAQEKTPSTAEKPEES